MFTKVSLKNSLVLFILFQNNILKKMLISTIQNKEQGRSLSKMVAIEALNSSLPQTHQIHSYIENNSHWKKFFLRNSSFHNKG